MLKLSYVMMSLSSYRRHHSWVPDTSLSPDVAFVPFLGMHREVRCPSPACELAGLDRVSTFTGRSAGDGMPREHCGMYCDGPVYASVERRVMISLPGVEKSHRNPMLSDLASCFVFSLTQTSQYAI